ncbi:rhomboid protein [Carex littledalei]|uniref:Rhomboid protein n=1 Tax=Carex littledalei TaxID=544730 RepID=A0A833QE89_9POAL|nr:rhomboid protein [Carex littledalei]
MAQLLHLLSLRQHNPPTRRHLHVGPTLASPVSALDMWRNPVARTLPKFRRRLDKSPSLVFRSPHFICNARGSDFTPHLELEDKSLPDRRVNGVFWILLLNLGLYVADHLLMIREIKALYLYHDWPAWYQFVTATFCHANWQHLSSNLFFVYIFGKLVEEEEGNLGLWISYILTGVGANLVSWLVLPRSAVSLGASGAVFGLFAISVLVKMSWDWRKIIEVLILGQFVIDKVMEAAHASAGYAVPLVSGYSLQVNHIAHLSGALIGAALVLLIGRIPSQSAGHDTKTLRGNKDKKI